MSTAANMLIAGRPGLSPALAINMLRNRLADPALHLWKVDGDVTVTTELNDNRAVVYTASVWLTTSVQDPLMLCEHDKDPYDCNLCTPF